MLTRRQLLRRGGALSAFGLAASWAACGGTTNNNNSGSAATRAASAAASVAATRAGTASVGSGTAAARSSTTPGAAGATSTAPAGKPGGNLMLTGSDLQQLDFQSTISTPTQFASSFVFSRLMAYDPYSDEATYILRPDLASSWEQTADKVVFHLRPGVKWQNLDPMNGRELTSEDIKFSMTRVATNKPAFVHAYKLDPVSSIETPDKYTVVFNLKRAAASLLTDIASAQGMGIVPPELIMADGDLNKRWVGTGPFMLDKWQKGSFIRFVKNPTYWKTGLPYLDSVQFNFITDASTNLANFLAGNLHYYITGDKAQFDQIQKGGKATLKTFPNLGGTHKLYNLGPNGVPALRDLRVRQAIDLAIDRGQLLDLVLGGDGVWAGTPVPLQYGDWSLSEADLKKQFAPNVAEAKKLMDATGLGKVTIPAEFSNIDTVSADEFPLLKQMLAPIGIDLQITVQERTIYLQSEVDHSFHLQGIGMGAYADPDNYLFPVYYTNGSKNYGQVDDPALNKLIDAEQAILDHGQRVAAIQAIQKNWKNYLYRTYTLNPNNHHAWQKNMNGQFIEKGWDYQGMEAVSFAS